MFSLAFLSGHDTIVTMPPCASKETFTFHSTIIREKDHVDWYLISSGDQKPYFRLRNLNTGAEMKLSVEELYYVMQVIMGKLSHTALTPLEKH